MRVRPLASAGVGAAVVFTLGWIVAGAVSEPVDATRGTINDLGAQPVALAWLWNVPRAVSGLLIVAVCAGLRTRLPQTRGTRAGVLLLGLFGVAQALALVFRRDCLTTDPTCDHDRSYSWQHVGHELISPLGSVGLVVALVLLARCFRDEPGLRVLWQPSVAALAVLVATLALFAVVRDSDGVGVVQRLSATAVYVWIAVVAVTLDQRPRSSLAD